MRQVRVLALMIALAAVLSSCSSGSEDTALLLRTKYLECTALRSQVEIRADYGQSVYDFTVQCTINSGGGTVTVTQPESIAGITAKISGEDFSLAFDGVEFTTGQALDISPASAPALLFDQWCQGYITSTCSQQLNGTDTLCVTTKRSDDITQTTWFDAAALLPVESEIYSGGRMIIKCVFTNVEIS